MNPDYWTQWLINAFTAHEQSSQRFRRGIASDHRSPSKGRSPQRHNEIVAQREKSKAARVARRKNRRTR